MPYHISNDGKPRPCSAPGGACPLSRNSGAQHYDTLAEAYEARISDSLDKVQVPTVSATFTAPPAEARDALLELFDVNDDEDALADAGFDIDHRDQGIAWLRDSGKLPENPQAVLELMEHLLDVDYDDFEEDYDEDDWDGDEAPGAQPLISAEGRAAANTWVAQAREQL